MSAENQEDTWSFPQELEGPLPRRVRLEGTGIACCAFALAWIVFGVSMAARVCLPELRRQAANDSLTRRLMAEGRETEATVTLQWTIGEEHHYIGYDYTVDGRDYHGNAGMASEHWQPLQVGSHMAIRYLPSDPTKAYPDADLPNSQNYWYMASPLAGFVLIFPLLFAALGISAVWPKYRLLARGYTARGVVTRCNGPYDRRPGRLAYYLHYEFPLPDGGRCQGSIPTGWQLEEGSSVPVL